MVGLFYLGSAIVFALVGVAAVFWPPVLWSLVVLGPVFLLGVLDSLQKRQAIRRNFPLIGNFRYLFEMVRPEINQYFVESNTDGQPFNRELRGVVYQRAKRALQTLPFGTQRDVYAPGYEWINHSLAARHAVPDEPRVMIGAERCERPYSASLLNISAMSFGALSSAAIRALNGGARIGGFAHNTGEGGVSPYHREPGGDLVWQIGTGYFGCRAADGSFDEQAFADCVAGCDSIRMIEVKLSQGAKPGHGGILPAVKISPEIAAIRNVPLGRDVISPPAHSAFETPRGLLEFVTRLREVSGGRPVGFKLCVGHPSEFLAICMAMCETGQRPDFIAVDGGEGGTGAAPLEFSNSIGAPLTEGLLFVHNALVGFGLRRDLALVASGKIITGFDMAARIAAGADLCASARGFMFSLGCIQARRCNSNHCPAGVTTQNPALVRGLVVTDKTQRVASYHEQTIQAFLELLGAAGVDHPDDLGPSHVFRRISHTDVRTYAEIYDYLEPGELLAEPWPGRFDRWMRMASPERFAPSPPPSAVTASRERHGAEPVESAPCPTVDSPST